MASSSSSTTSTPIMPRPSRACLSHAASNWPRLYSAPATTIHPALRALSTSLATHRACRLRRLIPAGPFQCSSRCVFLLSSWHSQIIQP
ncbi:hypothetical protein B0H19DRAFT_1180840 [Mycena capillaripes]|nr:hypothetical protein B0H19DRAFT_1180840 [Mycena capillaripes]